MSIRCYCPDLPAMGPTDPVPAGPIVCSCCGHPLELTCKGCGQKPSNLKNADIAIIAKSAKRPRMYAPKVCACGATFTPTGPQSRYCAACKEAADG